MDIQQLWQTQQVNASVEELIAQAKRRQTRMALLMLLDIAIWAGSVVFGALFIRENAAPTSFAIGLFIIFSVSIATAYMAWVRANTWGADSLSPRGLITLMIRRAKAGKQVVTACYVTYLIMVMGILLIEAIIYGSMPIFSLLRISFIASFGVVIVVVGEWYRAKQKKVIANLTSRLAQLEDNLNEPNND